MIKHTLVLLLVLPVALHAGAVHAQEPIPAASPTLTAEFLLETLSNRDESIRREAFRRLKQDESIDALPRLVDAIRSGDEGTATRAALAFVGRLDFLRRNTAPNAKQRLLLSDEDRQHLAAVAELLSDRDVEHWRWYLAESVLEQIVPSEFVEYLPELTLAVNEAHPMRQFAALRGLLLVDAEHAAEVKPALLRALRQRGRPRFVGIYLRYDRTIENNRVAFTSDIWSAPAHSTQFTFYADDQLLILAALLHFGVKFDEVARELVFLSRHENQSVRQQAAEQLTQLGSPGLKAADAALAPLLLDRGSPLVRELADEDDRTRESAIALIGRLHSDANHVVEPLALLLDSSADRLRQSAAIALGQLGPSARHAIPALRRAIETERLLAVGAVLSPESQQRADERYRDMQAALESIESPPEDAEDATSN